MLFSCCSRGFPFASVQVPLGDRPSHLNAIILRLGLPSSYLDDAINTVNVEQLALATGGIALDDNELQKWGYTTRNGGVGPIERKVKEGNSVLIRQKAIIIMSMTLPLLGRSTSPSTPLKDTSQARLIRT